MLYRRHLVATCLAAPGLLLASRTRAADDYPVRAITVLTGFSPGGLTDLSTRAITQRMARELGQPIVVDNRPGGATSLASNAAAQARADGYTLLMGASSLAINPALQPDLPPQRPLEVLIPIGMGYRSAFVLHVHPALPVRSTSEFIDYARANPGKVNFGSSGTGAVNHLCLEMFRHRVGADLVHVPYRGGAPALIDLQAGRIQAMFSAVLEAQPLLRDGRTRGLAVSSKERVAVVPELPPVADVLPGFDGVFWQGLFAPTGTPASVLDKVGSALRIATADPDLRSRLAEQGVTLQAGDAAVLRETLVSDTVLWGQVIREGHIKPD